MTEDLIAPVADRQSQPDQPERKKSYGVCQFLGSDSTSWHKRIFGEGNFVSFRCFAFSAVNLQQQQQQQQQQELKKGRKETSF